MCVSLLVDAYARPRFMLSKLNRSMHIMYAGSMHTRSSKLVSLIGYAIVLKPIRI